MASMIMAAGGASETVGTMAAGMVAKMAAMRALQKATMKAAWRVFEMP